MFDQHVLVDDSLRNLPGDGQPSGYAVDLRIPYYRGLGLSMVEVDLTIDGQAVPRENVTFSVHGNSYRSDQMDEVYDDRWPFTEPATLSVRDGSVLTPGEHTVTARVLLRVSYSPGGSGATVTKTLAVA